MWIILITKLQTDPSPPKLSIFWSLSWPDDQYAKEQENTCQICGRAIEHEKKYLQCDCPEGPTQVKPEDSFLWNFEGRKDANWLGARRIHYKDSDIRVFPHEFTVLKPENMKLYVLGDPENNFPPSHIFVPGSVASENIQKVILEGDLRHIYDAALIDGATEVQAMAVAQEIDITLPDAEFPPTGWYRCRREYAEIYCYEEEMQE